MLNLQNMTVLVSAILLTAAVVWLMMRFAAQRKWIVLNQKLQHCEQALAETQQVHQTVLSDKNNLLQQCARMESQLQFITEQYKASQRYQKENEQLYQELATTKAKLAAAEEKLLLQKNEIEDLGNHFRYEFKHLAQAILEEKTQRFTELNEEKMNAVLAPLKAQLGEFKQKVEETYDKESKERFSLGREVQRLIEMSQRVSQEANNLTTALKGNVKVQGNWGEMILESLLENSGLTKGREYKVQEFLRDNAGNVIKDEMGKGLQPDMIIYYPDNRKVIVDSKVSLIAWDEFVACTHADAQQECLQQLIRSVRAHIDGLSRKNYPKYALALDYVLLFIPIEPAFLEAVKADVHLWKYAYDKRILLVSPTNLFAVLKIVADLWKVETQNKHALHIASKAGDLYDKFEGFITNLETVGRKLADANAAYETAFSQLATGKGNIMNRVEELKKMGANAKKQLPARLLAEE